MLCIEEDDRGMIGEKPPSWSNGSRQAISHEFSAAGAQHSRRRGPTTAHTLIRPQAGAKTALFAVLDTGGIRTRRQLQDFVRQTHTIRPDRASRKRPNARVVSSLRADGPVFLSVAAIAPSAVMKTRLLPRPNAALAARRTAKIDARGNQVGSHQHSDLRQSPELLRAGERHICQRRLDFRSRRQHQIPTSGGKPESPSSTLCSPITRPIPHCFQTEPTRYEHGRARSSEQFTAKPARSHGGQTPLRSTLWLQKTCSQPDEEYPTFWSTTPMSSRTCISRSSPFEP